MENLTEQEEQVILKLAQKHPEVQKLYDMLQYVKNDPRHKFHLGLTGMLDKLSDEMINLKNNKPTLKGIISGEDKVFERVKSLLVDGDKIFTGITKGMKIIAGTDEPNDPASKDKTKEGDKPFSYENYMTEIKEEKLSGKETV